VKDFDNTGVEPVLALDDLLLLLLLVVVVVVVVVARG
jgi:hypothetical protein